MNAIQEQIALTSTIAAVLATALVALLGWGPEIAVEVPGVGGGQMAPGGPGEDR
ncbi:hypothetical protein BH10ACT1_BH10ACT1_13550 [soil metagenome]